MAEAASGNGVVLELDDIHTYYGAIHALKGVSLKVYDAEVVTLIGANGAGKSTTLRSISSVAHEGRITFQGRDIAHSPPHRKSSRWGSRSRPKDAAFSAHERAREPPDGRLPAHRPRQLPKRTWTVSSTSSRGSPSWKQQQAGTMSGGEQQMCAIGRALMARPNCSCSTSPRWAWRPSSSRRSSRSWPRSTRRGRRSCS